MRMKWRIRESSIIEAETKEKAREMREDLIGRMLMLVEKEDLVSVEIETTLESVESNEYEKKEFSFSNEKKRGGK